MTTQNSEAPREPKHGEPWLPYSINGIDSSDRETIIGRIHQQEHRDRAIACVNGCQGIANAAAVKDAVDALQVIVAVAASERGKTSHDCAITLLNGIRQHASEALRRLRQTETDAKKGESADR